MAGPCQQHRPGGAHRHRRRVAELASAAGAHRAQRITVVAPSHAPILEPVSDGLRAGLSEVPERKLVATYVTISRARPARTSADVLEDLAVSVSRTMRWRDAVGVIAELETARPLTTM